MSTDELNKIFERLEHDLKRHKRCFDLVKIVLTESEKVSEDAMKLLTQSINEIQLTETWLSSVKGTFLATKPEKGIS